MAKRSKCVKLICVPVLLLVLFMISCGCTQYGGGNGDAAGYGGSGSGPGYSGSSGTSTGSGTGNGYGYGSGTGVGSGTGTGTGFSAQTLSQYPIGVLTPEEEEWILYMAEEEKLARDVYLNYYDKWGSQVFSNIAGSEQTHMDSMALLIDRYGLENPVNDERGVFTNQDLQAVYNDLVSSGAVSEIDALKNSAYIEELDIVDLDDAIASTDKQDLILVYNNLRSGSENHLRAFIRNLGVLQPGFEPGPVILPQDEFDKIVGS